jgi:hypothetical protein
MKPAPEKGARTQLGSLSILLSLQITFYFLINPTVSCDKASYFMSVMMNIKVPKDRFLAEEFKRATCTEFLKSTSAVRLLPALALFGIHSSPSAFGNY